MRFLVEVPAQAAAVGSGPPGAVRLEVVLDLPDGPGRRCSVALEATPAGRLLLVPAGDLSVDPIDLVAAVTASQWVTLAAQAARCDHWEYRSIDGLAWRDSLPAEMALLEPVLATLARGSGDRRALAAAVLDPSTAATR